jgi:hypothetical protein
MLGRNVRSRVRRGERPLSARTPDRSTRARASERIVSGSVEAIDPPNLDDLRLRRNLRDLLIRFTSTTSLRGRRTARIGS